MKTVLTALSLSLAIIACIFGVALFEVTNTLIHRIDTDESSVTTLKSEVSKLSAPAKTVQLGVCYDGTSETFNDGYDPTIDGYNFVTSINLASPSIKDGVVSCQQGYTFVPVTPGS